MQRTYERHLPVARAVVFARLADLARYETWLPTSDMYRGSALISEGAIHVGSVYEDRSWYGAMQGEIVAFEDGRTIGFQQAKRTAGVPTRITVTYTLSDEGEGTTLHRLWELEVPWLLGWAPRLIAGLFRRENERVLDCLEASFASGEP